MQLHTTFIFIFTNAQTGFNVRPLKRLWHLPYDICTLKSSHGQIPIRWVPNQKRAPGSTAGATPVSRDLKCWNVWSTLSFSIMY